MRRTGLAKGLLIAGAVFLIPGAIMVAVFAIGATFIVCVGFALVGAPAYLSSLVRTSYRLSIVIQKVEPPTSNGHRDTRVWYGLANGKVAKMSLGRDWNGHVKEGDRLDALTDASGSVRRLFSTPPA